LGAGRRDQPGPLVVAGTPAVLDRLAATSTHLQRLAGRLIPEQCDHPRTLVRQAEIAVERYLGRRRDQALEQLAEARLHRPDSVHTGIEACWEAANAGRPALLVVEEGYAVPGTSSGVDEIARRPGDGAVYDRVDDLIEVVISRNGLLAFVEDDALHDLDRVSLVTRSGRVEERGDVPAWPNRP
jgi:Bacterial archaeo-eukaryotic release factor family 3